MKERSSSRVASWLAQENAKGCRPSAFLRVRLATCRSAFTWRRLRWQASRSPGLQGATECCSLQLTAAGRPPPSLRTVTDPLAGVASVPERRRDQASPSRSHPACPGRFYCQLLISASEPPQGPRGRSAAAVAADGGRADGKGRDAAHGCQRCRQRLRLHVEINPNRVDSALSLSRCCVVSCRVPAGTRRIGPGRLPCATTLGRTLRDRPSRPAYRKL